MAYALLDLPDVETFRKHAEELLCKFPNVKSWLEWWMRDGPASMLFISRRKMDPKLWDELPDSTNAEEAMHAKIYTAVGRDHSLMHGVRSLLRFIRYYERLLAGALEGTKIRYGQAEPWKQVAKLHGRTKLSRAPNRVKQARYKNDGRPPDTAKALLIQKKRRTVILRAQGRQSSEAKADSILTVFTSDTTDSESESELDTPLMSGIVAPGPLPTTTAFIPATVILAPPISVTTSSLSVITTPIPLNSESNLADGLEIEDKSGYIQVPLNSESNLGLEIGDEGYRLSMDASDQYPSYPWASNSCWLDSALEAIFQVIMRDFSSFETRFAEVPTNSVLYQLYRILDQRRRVYQDRTSENNKPAYLSIQRDALREVLYNASIVESLDSCETVFVSTGLLQVAFMILISPNVLSL